eukprot:scaffold38273_cov71-Phaeocystis_antarctica.AAC.2
MYEYIGLGCVSSKGHLPVHAHDVLVVERVAVDQHHRLGAQRRVEPTQPDHHGLRGAARRPGQLDEAQPWVRGSHDRPVLSAEEVRVVDDHQLVLRPELERVQDPEDHWLAHDLHERLRTGVALLLEAGAKASQRNHHGYRWSLHRHRHCRRVHSFDYGPVVFSPALDFSLSLAKRWTGWRRPYRLPSPYASRW